MAVFKTEAGNIHDEPGVSGTSIACSARVQQSANKQIKTKQIQK